MNGLLPLLLLLAAPTAERLDQDALAQAQARNFPAAERLWKQAIESSPRLFSPLFNLGYMYQSQERFAEAEPFLRRAAQVQPGDFNVQYLLGATLSRLGQTDDALRAWRAALALRPDHAKLMQVMIVEYSRGRYFREAASLAGRALANGRADRPLLRLAVKAYQDAGDHAEALRIVSRLAQAQPGDAWANFEYAWELHRAGRPDEALLYVRRAMAAPDTWEEPYFLCGDILLTGGKAEEALDPLRKAVVLRPDFMAARTALGRALLKAGRLDEAAAELEKAVQIDPTHPQPHLLLSQLWFRKGDEEKAATEKQMGQRLREKTPEKMELLPGRRFRD